MVELKIVAQLNVSGKSVLLIEPTDDQTSKLKWDSAKYGVELVAEGNVIATKGRFFSERVNAFPEGRATLHFVEPDFNLIGIVVSSLSVESHGDFNV